MNKPSTFLIVLTVFATQAPAVAAKDEALLDQARRNQTIQAEPHVAACQQGMSSQSLKALDHGPRATTTPWVLAQRKRQAADAVGAQCRPT
ncbi:MAG: hypothetical protein JO218_10350 [Burkholderiales bacterium]|nr:hypothetical protein [Burkholderiales bacterium]